MNNRLFFMYQSMFNQRGKSRDGSKKIKSHLSIVQIDENCFALRHHDTYIVKAYLDGRVILNNGGWQSATTKKFMNKYALNHLRMYLYQSDFTWYIQDFSRIEHSYHNGMNVNILDCVILDSLERNVA